MLAVSFLSAVSLAILGACLAPGGATGAPVLTSVEGQTVNAQNKFEVCASGAYLLHVQGTGFINNNAQTYCRFQIFGCNDSVAEFGFYNSATEVECVVPNQLLGGGRELKLAVSQDNKATWSNELEGAYIGSGDWTGPIFLCGHDPDFHAQGSQTARNLFEAGMDYVTYKTWRNTNPAQKFIWVESYFPAYSGHRIGEYALPQYCGGSIDAGRSSYYTRVNAAEFAVMSNAELFSHTALAIASNFGGMTTYAEFRALNARKYDIEAYIKKGGGIFAPSECYVGDSGCRQTTTNLQPNFQNDELYGFMPTTVTSTSPNAPFTVPANEWGNRVFGLVSADVNDPTHNSFGLTGGLEPISYDSGSPKQVSALGGRLNPCPADCNYPQGTCSCGTCVCGPSFYGEACECAFGVANCQVCGNGVLNTGEECDGGMGCSGSCTCQQGFTPTDPRSADCKPATGVVYPTTTANLDILQGYRCYTVCLYTDGSPNNCNEDKGWGTCDGLICRCNTGHFGEDCKPLCGGLGAANPLVCSGRGTCVAPDTCVCTNSSYWTGEQCNIPIIPTTTGGTTTGGLGGATTGAVDVPCSTLTTCADCAARSSCGWCDGNDLNGCMGDPNALQGFTNDPTDASFTLCQINSGIFSPNSCSSPRAPAPGSCGAAADCDSCQATSGCAWCQSNDLTGCYKNTPKNQALCVAEVTFSNGGYWNQCPVPPPPPTTGVLGPCVPRYDSCADKPNACGPLDDGCGKLLDCGSPAACSQFPNSECNPSFGVCLCVPKTCSNPNYQCNDAPIDDGCGGTLPIDACGTCTGGDVCKSNMCVSPSCTVTSTCEQEGKICGSIQIGAAGCPQSPYTCGQCIGNTVCSINGTCDCLPTNGGCNVTGVGQHQCGSKFDGCAARDCGTCAVDEECLVDSLTGLNTCVDNPNYIAPNPPPPSSVGEVSDSGSEGGEAFPIYLIGIIIGGALLCLAVAALAIFLVRRQRQKQADAPTFDK